MLSTTCSVHRRKVHRFVASDAPKSTTPHHSTAISWREWRSVRSRADAAGLKPAERPSRHAAHGNPPGAHTQRTHEAAKRPSSIAAHPNATRAVARDIVCLQKNAPAQTDALLLDVAHRSTMHRILDARHHRPAHRREETPSQRRWRASAAGRRARTSSARKKNQNNKCTMQRRTHALHLVATYRSTMHRIQDARHHPPAHSREET